MDLIIENKGQREELYNHIKPYLEQAKIEMRDMALLFLKIRDLRQLEINIGYDALELISKKLQTRLISSTKSFKLVIPIALDTFVVIIPRILNQGHAMIIANKLLREVQIPVKAGQELLILTPFIGIASSENCKYDERELYLNALIAFEKGNASESSCTLYKPQIKNTMKKTWDVKKDIELAVIDSQFELYFQPKIDLKAMKVCGAEALIRWNHPVHGLRTPNDFIPVAEKSGQIQSITEWVIKSALRHLSEILKTRPEFVLSINISASNLDSTDLMLLLEDSLSIWNIPSKNLVIEVTESTIMRNAQSSLNQLEKVRKIGIGVSIDDFGTGYSSLAYFKNIPATELKIDRSFVENLLDKMGDRHIVSLIVFLAKRFELTVVAEGIENQEVLDEIRKLQVDYGQGFFFSKPLCFTDFIKWCENF